MATSFSLVYEKFLHIVDDLDLGAMIDEDLKDEMYHFMDFGISLFFTSCVQDLTDVDLVNEEFAEDLDRNTINIIAYSMLRAWAEQKINTLDNMVSKIGTRDFKPSSSQAHLDKLMKRKQDVEKDLRRFISEYDDENWQGYDE